MSYIEKGDFLLIDGKEDAIAIGSDYTELYYDSYAREMSYHGLDYGVARGVVKILYPRSGNQAKVELGRVKLVSKYQESTSENI